VFHECDWAALPLQPSSPLEDSPLTNDGQVNAARVAGFLACSEGFKSLETNFLGLEEMY
jgi:hypothetical protein